MKFKYIKDLKLANKMLHEICNTYNYCSCAYEYLEQCCKEDLRIEEIKRMFRKPKQLQEAQDE